MVKRRSITAAALIAIGPSLVAVLGSSVPVGAAGPPCTTDCYVSPFGSDLNGGSSFADAKKTIQAGIATVQAGGTVHVDDGTYPESPNITKSLTLESEHGAAATTIDLQTGPTYLGSLTIAGHDVTVEGFTIEGFDGSASALAATNITVLPNLGDIVITDNVLRVGAVGSASNGDDGIGVLTYWDTVNDTDSLTVSNNRFEPLSTTGTRAFYVNPGTDAFLAEGNVIDGDFQRTAVTQAKHGFVRGNTVTGSGSSASLGTWGYPDPTVYGATEFDANTISGTASGFRIRGSNHVAIHHNLVSSVTDGVTVIDDPADGITGQLDGATVVIRDNSFSGITGKRVTSSYPNAVDASANWWGSMAVSASDITGPVDFTPVLTIDTDTSGSSGFQGSVDHLKVHALGAQVGAEGRIQEGIDTTVAGGLVDVAPGVYSETATGRTTPQVGPTYQFGLYVGTDRDGVTIRGVDAADVPITTSAGTLARITTNATNNFGYSGTFVYGADVTFQGLEFGTNSPSSNKTFEILGDGFSLLDSYVNDDEGSVYFGDWSYDTGTDVSSIASFTIHGDRFAPDNQITIANGTGYGHPESGRQITDNTFDSAPTGLFISFRGAAGPGGVPWYTYPVGGAVITGNTFGPADIAIRATDDYDASQFDWQAFRADNTFTRLVWVEEGNTGDLRAFAYSSSGYAFTNARQLGGRIDQRATASRPAGVQIAQAGDSIHVRSGTYPEQAIVDKGGVTVAGYGPTRPLIDDGGAATGNGILITGDGVTLTNVKIQGYEVGVRLGGGSDSLLDGVSVLDVVSTDNSADGLFASAIAGLSHLTIDGGTYSNNANTGVTVPGGRGIVVWDGPKSDLSITNVTAHDNGLVGIDINDGSVTGLTITGDSVVGNVDSGIAVLGATGPGANLVAENTVTDNGRFGIEVKDPTGSGTASGAGSVVVSQNTVSMTTAADRAQDIAGIAVFRRSVGPLNASQPSGAYVLANTVTGYQNAGGGDGFGIVVEGTDQTVTQNVVTGNDVGVQAQAANPSNPSGDATQTGTDWFDRGNAASYSGAVSGNSITGNTLDFRAVGLSGAADASGNWWGTTDQSVVAAHIVGTVDFTPYFHTGTDISGSAGFQGDHSALDVVRIGAQVGSGPRIQEAIDMVTGSTVYVHAGTYVEDVLADVDDLHLLGAQSGVAVAGRTFGDATEATVSGRVTIQAVNVLFDGFSVTNPNHAGSVTGILVKSVGDGATITNDIVSGVTSTSPANLSSLAQAIYLELGPDDVSVTSNRIDTVSSRGSAKGIYVGDSSSNDPSTGILIDHNVISGVTSTARGAYGIQHNNGVNALGHAELTITDNTVSGLAGALWARGIGIEGDAPGLVVTHNRISGLTAPIGLLAAGVYFEADPSYDEAEIHLNSLAIGPTAYGVGVNPALSLTISTDIDAVCNWWGTVDGPGSVAAGSGSLVSAKVDYLPWLVDDSLDDASCDLTPLDIDVPAADLSGPEGTLFQTGGTILGPVASIDDDSSLGTFAASETSPGVWEWTWTLAAANVANDGPEAATITVTATATNGVSVTDAFGLDISNVAPTASLAHPLFVGAGSGYQLELSSIVEPATADAPSLSYTFTCAGAAESGATATNPFDCTAPTTLGWYQVAATIRDKDGGSTAVGPYDIKVVDPGQLGILFLGGSSFPDTEVGAASTPQTYTLANNSPDTYLVKKVGFFVTLTNDFEVLPDDDTCANVTLGPGDECTFLVRFTPQTRGLKGTTLGVQFQGAQPGDPVELALSGTGIAAAASVTPDELDFGDRDVSAGPSAAQIISIENTGDAGSSLTILSITRTGSSAFAESYPTPVPLGVGDTLDIAVVFDPASVGERNGSIVVRTSAGTFSVALTGTGTPTPGPALSISPMTYNFGDVTVDHAKTRQFTVVNPGTVGLTGLVVAVSGDDLSVVPDDSTCDETTDLASAESCTVTVRYQPAQVGDDTGSLDATADGGLAASSSLTGSGVPGAPIVTVSPGEHEFAPIVVGDTPDDQDFTVRNTGDTTLTGLAVQVTGAAAFTIMTGAGTNCEVDTTSLAPDATCVVWVRFAPGAGGDKTGTLKVLSSNAGNGTVNVPLSGTALAPALSISPGGYDFGDVTVGHSRSRTFTVANTGTAPLAGLVVEVTGDDLSIVAGDSDCDETSSLDAGESCQVKVRYQPGQAGDDTGSLDATADGGSFDDATLRGSGVPAKGLVAVTPDEGDFGSIETGATTTLDFAVENTGDAGLTFSNVSLTGSSTFAIEAGPDTDCLTEAAGLAPGDTCVIRIRFAPGSVGDRSATLKIQSDAANTTVNVPLTGTATPHPSDVSVTPNPYDFGHIPFKATKSKVFTVTNSGGTPVTITSVTRTGSSTFAVISADDECDGETLGTDEACSFVVRFNAPINTAGVKNGVIHLVGSGFDEILVPVSATAEPFKAKVDAFITDKTDKPSNYVGVGVYCTSSCSRQQVSERVARGRTFTYRVRIRNNGNGVDTIRVRLYQTASKASIKKIQVLRNGNQDVTSRVTNGSYVARDVNPGAQMYFWVRVTVKANAVRGRVNYVILSGQSTRTPVKKDYVRAKTTVR